MQVWDMMIVVSGIEDQCIKLRKLTCDGNMIHGHTVNVEKATTNAQDVWHCLEAIEQRIKLAKERYNAE